MQPIYNNALHKYVSSIFLLLENSIERIIIKKANRADNHIFISLKQITDSNQQTKKTEFDKDTIVNNISDSTINCVKNYVYNQKLLCSCLIDQYKFNNKITYTEDFFDFKKFYDAEDDRLYNEYMENLVN